MNITTMDMIHSGVITGGGALDGFPKTRFEKMRPHKGGGSSKAADRSVELEEERQRKATEAINAINKVFSDAGRQSNYDQIRNDTYDLNAREVERQAQEAERANRFALARNGLLGGSADIDSNAEIARRTNDGLIQAGAVADAARSDYMNSDESSRNNLINMANSGTDAQTANMLAVNNLKNNAETARANSSIASVGDLFGTLGNAYLYNDLSKANQELLGKYQALNKQQQGNSTQSSYSGNLTKGY